MQLHFLVAHSRPFNIIPVNCPYLIGTVPILTTKRGNRWFLPCVRIIIMIMSLFFFFFRLSSHLLLGFRVDMYVLEVPWLIEPLALDQRVAGSTPIDAWHFCPFVHIAALHPGVQMGIPGRMQMLFVANKRVRNLAVRKEPWDISEVIRDKQKHSWARTTTELKEVFFPRDLSSWGLFISNNWRMRKWNTELAYWCGMCAPWTWRLARMLPRDLRRCTMSAGLILNPMTMGNNTLLSALSSTCI